MDWKLKPSHILIAALIGFIAWQQFAGKQSPAPLPPAPTPQGPDLLTAFSVNSDRGEARAHALAFACTCRTIAAIIEKDPKGRIKTGRSIEELRTATREFQLVAMTEHQLANLSFASKYPHLGAAVGNYLDATAGKSPKELDAATRAKWIQAFRGLAESSDYAAKNL